MNINNGSIFFVYISFFALYVYMWSFTRGYLIFTLFFKNRRICFDKPKNDNIVGVN